MPLKTDAEVKIDQMTLPQALAAKLIDRPALRAAVKAAKLPAATPMDLLKYRPDGLAGKWTGYSNEPIGTASLLCSITAACRGRMHATEKYVPRCDATGGSDKLQRTLEDQLALIGSAWKLFLKKDAAALLQAEEAAAAPPHLS